MANLLYITCNVKPQDKSSTLSLGYEFLEEYLRWHPHDEVQMLDLYRDRIQRVNPDVLNAWGQIERGEICDIYTDEERRVMSRIWRLADQFAKCNKYVFVTHSINLWFPAEFKTYIDAICVPGITYRSMSHGAVGMLSDRDKKSLHLHAGPALPFGREHDLSAPYLRSVLNVLGVSTQETILLQGDDTKLRSNDEYEAVQQRLLEMARHF